ncbi:glycosylphosphatidylinositol anchor biosynthesis [Coemansia sp. RSA 1933]|nr:glycosylphosphatidylinositol anchor biosynthesis [Coemansia sp. RSA 1933]
MRLFEQHLFLTLLALRLGNVYIVQTFTHPDETWQSLEVAHHAVFGYGFLTWEWRHALRGYAHPLLFATVYKALALLRLDDTWLLVLCSVMSLSMGTDIVRPLVNSTETALTAAAFALWPWKKNSAAVFSDKKQSPKGQQLVRSHANDDTSTLLARALGVAALSCIVRPTSGVVWIVACALLVFRQSQGVSQTVQRALVVVRTAICIGSIAIPAMLAIDRFGYKRWVFPPYQFYRFNVQQGLATWFGESHVLYHFYASVPVLFTSMLPFVLHGIYVASTSRRVSIEPAILAAAVLVLFSMVGHMEYRFVYPLLPIGFMYAGVSLDELAGSLQTVPVASDGKNKARRSKRLSTRTVLIYLFVTNIPAILYMDLVHQRGVIDVFRHLRRNTSANGGSVDSLGFLMPCHSTPFYSHMHRDIPMWFLSCEPPLERSALGSHYWEANDFEQSPADFVRDIFSKHPQITERTRRERPSHLVLYGCMAERVGRDLNDLGYAETARFFNTHFSPDSRRRGDIVVFHNQYK